jgi:transposase
VLFVGIDRAEDHHDVCVLDGGGEALAKGRVPASAEGVGRVHEMVGAAAADSTDVARVVIGIETDRGVFVRALLGAGYELVAVNPLSVDRYRDRHQASGAKSDPGDARVLAEMMRTHRHLHRRGGLLQSWSSELASPTTVLYNWPGKVLMSGAAWQGLVCVGLCR